LLDPPLCRLSFSFPNILPSLSSPPSLLGAEEGTAAAAEEGTAAAAEEGAKAKAEEVGGSEAQQKQFVEAVEALPTATTTPTTLSALFVLLSESTLLLEKIGGHLSDPPAVQEGIKGTKKREEWRIEGEGMRRRLAVLHGWTSTGYELSPAGTAAVEKGTVGGRQIGFVAFSEEVEEMEEGERERGLDKVMKGVAVGSVGSVSTPATSDSFAAADLQVSNQPSSPPSLTSYTPPPLLTSNSSLTTLLLSSLTDTPSLTPLQKTLYRWYCFSTLPLLDSDLTRDKVSEGFEPKFYTLLMKPRRNLLVGEVELNLFSPHGDLFTTKVSCKQISASLSHGLSFL